MPAVTIIRRVLLALLLWTALAAEVVAAEAGNIFGIKLPQSIEEMFEAAYDDAEARVTCAFPGQNGPWKSELHNFSSSWKKTWALIARALATRVTMNDRGHIRRVFRSTWIGQPAETYPCES